MDFAPSARALELAARTRAFMDDVVMPRESEVMRHGFSTALPTLLPLRDEAKRRGLWAPQLSTSLGGLGLSLVELAFVGEVLGESPLGHWAVNFQAPDAGNMELLHLAGTEAQQTRFLDPLARGDIRSCFAMTEPDRPGSNPTWMETTATKDGDDYVINGHKWFTTGADGAAFAIVMAVTNDAGKSHERASMFLVPMDTAGVVFVRNLPVMGEPRRASLRECAGAVVGFARRGGQGLCPRPGTPRPRPHPSLHALAGHLSSCLRPSRQARR